MRAVFHRVSNVEVEIESDASVSKLGKRKILNTSIILRVACIVCLATSSLLCILVLVTTIPGLHLPSNLEDTKYDVQVLKGYADNNEDNHQRIFIIFSLLYLWKQTFCVPGSILLNLIAGALYGMSSVPLLCLLTALGSTLCYYIFYFAGADILEYYIPKHLSKVRGQIEENRSSMFLYLLTIRLFPLTPYWLINIVSPFVGVPIWIFFLTCMLGIVPYNFVTVEAGQMLSQVDSVSDILNPWFIAKLFFISAVPFTLSLLGKKKKINTDTDLENGDWEEAKDEIGLNSSP